jgi:hypothetical protein
LMGCPLNDVERYVEKKSRCMTYNTLHFMHMIKS